MDEQEFRKSLFTCISTVAVAVGVKNLPDEILKNMIVQFIGEENKYYSLTPKQFIQAFMLNLRMEYDEVVQHFQAFDLTFIASVLNRYYYRVMKANGALRQYHRNNQDEYEYHNLKPQYYLDAVKNDAIKTVIDNFNKYCEVGDSHIFLPRVKYDLLLELKAIEEPTQEEKLKYFETARQKRLNELYNIDMLSDLREIVGRESANIIVQELKEGKVPSKEIENIKNIAMELVIKDNFKKWKENATDVTGLLIIKPKEKTMEQLLDEDELAF